MIKKFINEKTRMGKLADNLKGIMSELSLVVEPSVLVTGTSKDTGHAIDQMYFFMRQPILPMGGIDNDA